MHVTAENEMLKKKKELIEMKRVNQKQREYIYSTSLFEAKEIFLALRMRIILYAPCLL